MGASQRVVLAIVVFAIAALSSLGAQGSDAESVLKARETALAARDFDAVLGLFADDAVVVSSSGRLLIGKEQIRVWVQDQVDRTKRGRESFRGTHPPVRDPLPTHAGLPRV